MTAAEAAGHLPSFVLQSLWCLSVKGRLENCRGELHSCARGPRSFIGERVPMLDHPVFLEEGFQIGSGPTESKGRGRRWKRQGIPVENHIPI